MLGKSQSLSYSASFFFWFSAYNSPMILMHSGIGPKEHLTEMNIDCKVDLPGVGENLIDHPIVSSHSFSLSRC